MTVLTPRETVLRNLLIAERTKHKLAMDNAYPDVGMGLMPMVAQAEAEKEIDAEIEAALKSYGA